MCRNRAVETKLMLSGGHLSQFGAEHSRVHDVASTERQRLEHDYPPPPKKPLTPYMRFNRLVSICWIITTSLVWSANREWFWGFLPCRDDTWHHWGEIRHRGVDRNAKFHLHRCKGGSVKPHQEKILPDFHKICEYKFFAETYPSRDFNEFIYSCRPRNAWSAFKIWWDSPQVVPVMGVKSWRGPGSPKFSLSFSGKTVR